MSRHEPRWRSALRRAILLQGSQRKLARAAGCSQNAIWSALNRGRRVMPKLAAKIAAATDNRVTIDQLTAPAKARRRPA